MWAIFLLSKRWPSKKGIHASLERKIAKGLTFYAFIFFNALTSPPQNTIVFTYIIRSLNDIIEFTLRSAPSSTLLKKGILFK